MLAGRYLDNSAQCLNRTAQVPESDILKHPETTEISRLQTLKQISGDDNSTTFLHYSFYICGDRK